MSGLSLQEPYVVSILPRTADTVTARYICAEVHGSEPGSRKRKREMAVGIDGEAINLYDTSSSKLLTSYALPPNSSFTCRPCSIKSRKSKSNGQQRLTYTSTRDSTARIRLFRDIISTDGNTSSSENNVAIPNVTSPVVFIGTFSTPARAHKDLLYVHRSGEFSCLDGINLSSLGSSSLGSTGRPVVVDYCDVTDAVSASQGLFKHRPDILAFFPEALTQDTYNPELLLAITHNKDDIATRNLRVMSLPTALTTSRELLSVQLEPAKGEDSQYYLHAPSGVLYELAGQLLVTYSLGDGNYKKRSPMSFSEAPQDQAQSFLRLSDTSVAVSFPEKVELYHTDYNSVQASITLPHDFISSPRSDTSGQCHLASYSKSQNMILATRSNSLIAFQLDLPLNGSSKYQATGLLADAIGRGKPMPSIQVVDPGYEEAFKVDAAQVAKMDDFAAAGDVRSFEKVLAGVIGIQIDAATTKVGSTEKASDSNNSGIPSWNLSDSASRIIHQRKWVDYALRKVFSWTQDELNNDYQLRVQFYPHNVVGWLIDGGCMNKASLNSALREQLLPTRIHEIPTGQIVDALAEVDPSMTAVLSLLSRTYLEASEIVYAIRMLMESLELFGDEASTNRLRLTNDDDVEMVNGTAEDTLEDEEEAATHELQLAEFYLGDESSIRGQALSVAIAKLHASPMSSVVEALKSMFSSSEIVAFIYLLRFELARGSWTSRYLDGNSMVDDESETQDGNIVLITDLLNTCIDAIGSGGWLGGESMLTSGNTFESEELIASLKLEVSAALEGIEEATYLKGLFGDVIRYGEGLQKTTSERSTDIPNGRQPTSGGLRAKKNRPIVLLQTGRRSSILPFGMKVEQKVSLQKIGAGGEVTRRTVRDIGRLKSRKVGKYSRERIQI